MGRNQAYAEHSGVLVKPEPGYYGAFLIGRNQANLEHSLEAGTRHSW